MAGGDDVVEEVPNDVELDHDGTVRMRHEVLVDDRNVPITTPTKSKQVKPHPDEEPLAEVAVR